MESTTKSVAPAVNMKDISSKVNIRPFTSTKDLAWRTRPATVKKDKVSFMTLTMRKPRSCQPYEHTLHRMKWSQEMKTMPPLGIMNKSSSTALVGSVLSYNKTSIWCSSSSNKNKNMFLGTTKEDGEPFVTPGSTGEVIAEQLQQGIVLRICTIESNKSAKNCSPEKNINEDCVLEPVPLCFDDELQRKNGKVLTARPPIVYTALPIVSETYPVIYNIDQYQHEPFRSQGFHSLDSQKLQNSSVHSTFIRITDAMPKVPMSRSLRKTHPEKKTRRVHSVHVLSADGNVVKYPKDGSFFLRCRNVMASPGVFTNTSKSPPVHLRMPLQRNVKQTNVGPLVNGVNPNQDAERSPSDLKTLHKLTRSKLTRCSHMTPPQSQRGVNTLNGFDSIVISKPLQNNVKSSQKLKSVAKQQFHEESWSGETASISHNYGMLQVTNDGNFELNAASLSESRLSSVDHTFQEEAPEMSTHFLNDSNTCSETVSSANDSETPKPNPHLQLSHAINIPTAESYE